MSVAISPFSLSRDWTLHWVRIHSNYKQTKHIIRDSDEEVRALNALASVGLISGKQLSELFSINPRYLKRLEAEQKIIRHEMRLKNQPVAIYSLGINGAIVVGLEESYKLNYWIAYKIEDVLKRILFFQLFKHFNSDERPNQFKIQSTPSPFIGSIVFNEKPLFVYVVRGDTNDLLMYLKWNESSFNERLIVITESLQHLEPIKQTLSRMKVRFALDQDLLSDVEQVQSLFYFIEGGELKREL